MFCPCGQIGKVASLKRKSILGSTPSKGTKFCLTLNMMTGKIKLCESGGMVDTGDLKSPDESREGSTPSSRTK
jgi:hypothetical protein